MNKTAQKIKEAVEKERLDCRLYAIKAINEAGELAKAEERQRIFDWFNNFSRRENGFFFIKISTEGYDSLIDKYKAELEKEV